MAIALVEKPLDPEEIISIMKRCFLCLQKQFFKVQVLTRNMGLTVYIDVEGVANYLKSKEKLSELSKHETENALIQVFRDFEHRNPGVSIGILCDPKMNHGSLTIDIKMTIIPEGYFVGNCGAGIIE